MLERLSPLLTKLHNEKKKALFTITKQEPFALDITTEEGFNYTFTSINAYVSFEHKMRLKPHSGASPTLEMLSKPRPFTELLTEVSYRLREALLLIDPKSETSIDHIGVVSTTHIAEEDSPPGILRLIKHLGRPWDGLVPPYSASLNALIEKTEKFEDRCQHQVSKSDEKDSLITARFDWHRTFAPLRSARGLEELSTQAQKSAIAYLEDIAEGSRFDFDKSSS